MQSTLKGASDAFVARLDASGAQLLFSTYLGGSNSEDASDLALGVDGSFYVTGQTQSADFPVTRGVFGPTCDGKPGLHPCLGDAFVTRLDPTGRLIYSTYLGGSDIDSAAGVAVDEHGQAYIAGTTYSKDFPITRAYQDRIGGSNSNAFLSRLSDDGSRLVFSTYYGGKGGMHTFALAQDGRHNTYLVGTTAAGLPLLNPFQPTFGGGHFDGFIAEFNSKGQLTYASYLGGSSDDFAFKVVVDADGQAVVAGSTSSLDFPTANPMQATYGGGLSDAVVTKVAASGGSLIYSTYLGGDGDEYVYALHTDDRGGIWLGGSTSSDNFPLVHPFQSTYGGGPYDAFLTHIENPANPTQ